MSLMDSGNTFSLFAVMVGDGATAQTVLSTRNTATTSRFVFRAGNTGKICQIHNGTTPYNTSGVGGAFTSYILTAINDGTAKHTDTWRDSTFVGDVTWTGSYANAIFSVGLDRDNDWEIEELGCLLVFGSDETSNRADIETALNDYFGTH
jgi:hypothetical protein